MDFDAAKRIRVHSWTSFWGPFSFDFTSSLPTGDSIAQTSTVKSYLGGVETTDSLIEAASIAVVSPVVTLRLQYPGDALKGLHELHFLLVLASGAQQRFVFGYVQVS